eukprot:4797717-Prymnesium_polylepis.1
MEIGTKSLPGARRLLGGAFCSTLRVVVEYNNNYITITSLATPSHPCRIPVATASHPFQDGERRDPCCLWSRTRTVLYLLTPSHLKDGPCSSALFKDGTACICGCPDWGLVERCP